VRVELPKGSYTLALHRQDYVAPGPVRQVSREQPTVITTPEWVKCWQYTNSIGPLPSSIARFW
jgi:hypothetical protein